jgi:hypothetical protein
MNFRSFRSWLIGAALFGTALAAGAQAALPLPADSGYAAGPGSIAAGRTVYAISCPDGRTVNAELTVAPSAAAGKSVVAVLEASRNWQRIKPVDEVVFVDADSVRLRQVLGSLRVGSVDYAQYIPSGLVFVLNGSRLEYDFRLKVEGYFIRFQGVFLSEDALTGRMAQAVADPAAFVRSNDPDFLIRRIGEIQLDLERSVADGIDFSKSTEADFDAVDEGFATVRGRIEADEAAGIAAAQALADRAAALEARAQAAEDRLAAAEARLAASEAAAAALDARLAETAAAIDGRLAALEPASGRLETAAMALLSKGLFGAAKPIDGKAVERVLALRQATPTAAAKDLVAALKGEGIIVAEKQVKAILALVFGEY